MTSSLNDLRTKRDAARTQQKPCSPSATERADGRSLTHCDVFVGHAASERARVLVETQKGCPCAVRGGRMATVGGSLEQQLLSLLRKRDALEVGPFRNVFTTLADAQAQLRCTRVENATMSRCCLL